MPERGKLAEKQDFEDRIREVFASIGVDLIEGPTFEWEGRVHQVFEFRHHDQQVILWPVIGEELPGGGVRKQIAAYRKLYSTHLSEEYAPSEGDDATVGPALILLLEGYQIGPVDLEFAKSKDPVVTLWDDNALDYYKELEDAVGPYARFALFGELSLHPPEQETMGVTAFRTQTDVRTPLGKVEAYTFLADPKDLLEMCYVARREVREEHYYQRLLRKNKIRDIGNFIDDGNIIPNNVILALGEHIASETEFHSINTDTPVDSNTPAELGILQFPQDYRSLWIIDGQHRLYGFSRSNRTFPMMFTVFKNLPTPEQAKMFLDINENQKAVDKNLVWDIQGELMPESPDGMIANTVKHLALNPPLEDKIYVPSLGVKKRGKLKLNSLCRAIKRARLHEPETRSGATNPWYVDDPYKRPERIGDGIAEFFRRVAKVMPQEWFGSDKQGLVTKDGGAVLFVRLMERFVERIDQDHNGPPEPKEYDRFLDALDRVLVEDYPSSRDRKVLRNRLSSRGGRTEVEREFCLSIREILDDPKFCEDLVEEWLNQFRPIERNFQKLIDLRMTESHGEDWFDKKVPQHIQSSVQNYMDKAGEDDPDRQPYFLTLGSCIQIIRADFDSFKQDFLREEGPGQGYHTRNEVIEVLNNLSRFRNRFYAHASDERMRPDDEKQLQLILDRLNTLLEDALS